MPKKEFSFKVSSLILPKFVPLILLHVSVKLLRLFALKGFIKNRSYGQY